MGLRGKRSQTWGWRDQSPRGCKYKYPGVEDGDEGQEKPDLELERPVTPIDVSINILRQGIVGEGQEKSD